MELLRDIPDLYPGFVREVPLLHLNRLLLDPEEQGGTAGLKAGLMFLNVFNGTRLHLREGMVVGGHVRFGNIYNLHVPHQIV